MVVLLAAALSISSPAQAGPTQMAGVTTGSTFDPKGFSISESPGVWFKWTSLWDHMGMLSVKTCGSTVSTVTFEPKIGSYQGIETARSIVATQVAGGWRSSVMLEPGTGVYPVSSTAGIWHLTAGSSKLVISADTDSVTVVATGGPDC